MPRLVVDLADARPIFALPRRVTEALRAALPAGWELTVVDAPADGTGDGAERASSASLAAVADAEVYVGFGIPAALLAAGPRLRWVHSAAAGVRASLTPELRARDLVFTNSAGVHAAPVAETVLGYLLHFARGLDQAVASQREERWDRAWFDRGDSPVRELGRSTVGVVGLGGIGRAVAERVRAFGAEVLATRRRPDRPAGVAGVEVLAGDDALETLLARSHYVVLTLPETGRTYGLMGAARIARMRPDAVLVNVSRGRLVDEEALGAALRESRLRGAALDVFSREPLPPGHPLWHTPNVLITPHTSGYTHAFWEREMALLTANLARWVAGDPLVNVVDVAEGY